jgi:hypothetical protein
MLDSLVRVPQAFNGLTGQAGRLRSQYPAQCYREGKVIIMYVRLLAFATHEDAVGAFPFPSAPQPDAPYFVTVTLLSPRGWSGSMPFNTESRCAMS